MSAVPTMAQPSSKSEKRRALGRGLGALLPNPPPGQGAKAPASTDTGARAPAGAAKPPPVPGSADATGPAASSEPAARQEKRTHFRAQIEDVYPNPDQPRRRFAEEALEELAQSIRAHGVIQPIIVRARAEGGYILIAGERRWRASQRAGMTEIPIVVQEVSGAEAFERALIENVQRADLNAIEEAEAYQRLVDEFGYTQEQVAERVGKDRSTVANSLRLLKLPNLVRGMVEEGRLSMGHARALLSLEKAADIEAAAREVVAKALSVRAAEALVRAKAQPAADKAPPPAKSASVRDVEARLTKSLGAQVNLSEDRKGKGGTITVRYADLDDLDRLLERFLS